MLRMVPLLLFGGLAFGADLIVVNANVITVDPQTPHAEAFAVENGRFSAVGPNAEIRRLATGSTRVLDLHGMTVTPGFNDVHLHPSAVFPDDSPYATPWLGPDKVKNIEELIEALKKKAERTPKGMLVSGNRYDELALGHQPTRYDLDKASTDHPISIVQASGHVSVVNSYILNASGVTKETKDPPGGAFDRGQDGTPNGVVRESARNLLKHFPRLQVPPEAEIAGLLLCFRQYAARGLTSVGIAGGSPQSIRQIETVRKTGNPVRVGFMFYEPHFPALGAVGLVSGFGDDLLRLTSIKVFHGNSLSGGTCWLSQPYSSRPGYYGIPPARSQEDLNQAFLKMHEAGWQIATHSNGDREIAMVLTAIEYAQARDPRPDARHRIEHASVMTPELLERAQKDGVILVFHSYMWEHGAKLEEFYGDQRLAMIHPYRTAIDMGIHVAGHSDSPVSAADPLLRIQDMVTRKGSNGKIYGGNQRISADEAIKVWTLDGAYATFEEKIKGSIAAGKLADFVVLGSDPGTVNPDHIKDIAVEATYIGGKMVYSAPAVETRIQ